MLSVLIVCFITFACASYIDPDESNDFTSDGLPIVRCINSSVAPNAYAPKARSDITEPWLCGVRAPGKEVRCPYGQCCSKYGYCGPHRTMRWSAEGSFCNENAGDYRFVPCDSVGAVPVKPVPTIPPNMPIGPTCKFDLPVVDVLSLDEVLQKMLDAMPSDDNRLPYTSVLPTNDAPNTLAPTEMPMVPVSNSSSTSIANSTAPIPTTKSSVANSTVHPSANSSATDSVAPRSVLNPQLTAIPHN
uniref:Chitin-binding type-2 domain-containing protein n=1 Tax=Spongospora subterranea TaxID=70186 RepID=A0A0H5QQ38_9EUKA|eukprot:CRZ03551.1 hypothetical protein [Spongospora subterranea]